MTRTRTILSLACLASVLTASAIAGGTSDAFAEDPPAPAGALLDAVKKNSKTMVEYGLKESSQQEKNQALIEALSSNVKAEIVEILLNGGANPNTKDQQQSSALLLAIGKPKTQAAGSVAGTLVPGFAPLGPVRTKMAAALLAKGADPGAKNNDGDSALSLLAAKPEPALLEAFLKKSQNRDLTDGAGRTALMIAAAANNSANVEVLLKFPGKIDLTDAEGKTALMHAAEKGNVEPARKLIKAGAAVNHKDAKGQTPLLLATKENHSPMVKLLIASGADSSLASAVGQQALREAKNGANSELVENLKPQLTQAIEKNDLEAFEKMIAMKVPIDSLNPDGSTPLARAVELNRSNMASILLANGANTNARTGSGTPILVQAADNGDYGLVRDLLARGASIEATDKSGKTAQDHAEKRGYGHVVEMLKQAGQKK